MKTSQGPVGPSPDDLSVVVYPGGPRADFSV